MATHSAARITAQMAVTALLFLPMPAQTRELKLTIAGGEVLTFKTSNGAPLPAETAKLKIDTAGFMVGMAKDPAKHAGLTWTYGFSVKGSAKIANVKVEELSPTAPPAELIRDEDPTLTNGRWMGRRAAIDTTDPAIAWLFTNKPSAFIFRFTVRFQDGDVQVLHQLAVFSAEAKAIYAKLAKGAQAKP